MHCITTTSTSSFNAFQAGLFLPYQLRSCGLGQALDCLACWNLYFKPGYKQLLQTETLSLTFSSLPRKSKPAVQAGEGKEETSFSVSFISYILPQLQNPLSPPPPTAHSFWRISRLGWRRTQHSSNNDQGKTLTFSDIQYSPYSPTSRFILHLIHSAQFQLFSLKYQTLQRQKKFTLSSSSDTTSWNNSFLVDEMRAPFFETDPMFNMLLPLF